VQHVTPHTSNLDVSCSLATLASSCWSIPPNSLFHRALRLPQARRQTPAHLTRLSNSSATAGTADRAVATAGKKQNDIPVRSLLGAQGGGRNAHTKNCKKISLIHVKPWFHVKINYFKDY